MNSNAVLPLEKPSSSKSFSVYKEDIAIQTIKGLASQGDKNAQYELAQMYRRQSEKGSFGGWDNDSYWETRWCVDKSTKLLLNHIYGIPGTKKEDGTLRTLQEDYKYAYLKLLQQAAKQGHSEALKELAMLSPKGEHCKRAVSF